MNEKILEKIIARFQEMGIETISGEGVVLIIKDIVAKNTVPSYVTEAEAYVRECGRDLGFMGSPTYYEKLKIIDAYYAPIRTKEQEEKDIALYKSLKEKFESPVAKLVRKTTGPKKHKLASLWKI